MHTSPALAQRRFASDCILTKKPLTGLEPATRALQKRCSTTELQRRPTHHMSEEWRNPRTNPSHQVATARNSNKKETLNYLGRSGMGGNCLMIASLIASPACWNEFASRMMGVDDIDASSVALLAFEVPGVN